MKKILYPIFAFATVFLVQSCASSKYIDTSDNWVSVAKMEETEIFVDTTSIKRDDTMVLAKEKKIFTSQASKDEYIFKIKEKLGKKAEEKILKWNDLNYIIYTSEYDCINSRFRILSVEDYDSRGNRIIKTTPNKNKITWLNVDEETVGDYTFFFVCDYDN